MLFDTVSLLMKTLENDRYGSSKPVTTSRDEFLTYHFVHMYVAAICFSVPSLYMEYGSTPRYIPTFATQMAMLSTCMYVVHLLLCSLSILFPLGSVVCLMLKKNSCFMTYTIHTYIHVSQPSGFSCELHQY